MKRDHLDDRNFAAWALDPAQESAIQHFEICSECRREAVDFRLAVTAFSDSLHRAAEGRELVWEQKGISETRDALRAREPWRVLPRLIPVLALASILFAVALAPRTPKLASQPAPSQAADNALLIQIEQDLNRQAPESLAPAEALFADASTTQGSGGNKTQLEGTRQ